VNAALEAQDPITAEAALEDLRGEHRSVMGDVVRRAAK
jgi:hypothetical protein